MAAVGALVKYLEDTQKMTCAAKTLRVYYQGSEATAIVGINPINLINLINLIKCVIQRCQLNSLSNASSGIYPKW